MNDHVNKRPSIVLTDPSNFEKAKPIKGFLRTAHGLPADDLQDIYRGAAIFLMCGGPSLAELDLGLLNQRGIVTAACNNAGAVHRPDMVFMVDSPNRFHEALWLDPGVRKFTRVCVATDEIRHRSGGIMVGTGRRANEMPNAYFFNEDHFFTAQNFLTKARVAWQCEWRVSAEKRHVKRSVMLVAIRLLYWLGFRTVFLLGVDFKYQPGQTYAFNGCNKAKSTCGQNNTSMGVLREWFNVLRPEFEKAGFYVYNATPGSRLTSFDYVDLRDAVDAVAWRDPVDTTGLYGS